MSLFGTISSYNPSLKASLKEDVTFKDGDENVTFKAGTVSSILIDNDDGTYHFEAENSTVTVSKSELNFN